MMKKHRTLASVFIIIMLSTQIYGQKANSGLTESEELKLILKKCAEYCEKLGRSVLDFICYEKVTELIISYNPRMSESGHEAMTGHEKITVMGQDSGIEQSIEKNVYIYDYQLIRKENKVQERRTLIRDNGRKKNEADAPLKTKRFKHKDIIFGPIGLLSEFWQEYYDYKIMKREKFKGDRVVVIEAIPVPYMKTNNLYGKIWVKEDDFSIVKIEWAPKSIINYDLIEKESKKIESTPLIKLYSEYAFEKNGIRFPSKYYIIESYIRQTDKSYERLETYIQQMESKYLRSKTTVIYKDYKFFTVKTEVKYEESP